jgi:hypothetical protein
MDPNDDLIYGNRTHLDLRPNFSPSWYHCSSSSGHFSQVAVGRLGTCRAKVRFLIERGARRPVGRRGRLGLSGRPSLGGTRIEPPRPRAGKKGAGMISPDHLFQGSYDTQLVVWSVLISVMASYAVLEKEPDN